MAGRRLPAFCPRHGKATMREFSSQARCAVPSCGRIMALCQGCGGRGLRAPEPGALVKRCPGCNGTGWR